ncbi:MAG: glycosyltransferase [Candidatus Symbiothrix sp.]|jgi:glycosyltransferase involved in cell wall biosynthesis|nr:glycosyltransferase [Candidatus Symbiothrix sp.]
MGNKVLLIPDAYFGNSSGAIVAQIAKKLLLSIGNEVSVFSTDMTEDAIESDGTHLYYRTGYTGIANWREDKYIKEYEVVLQKTEATVIFTIGSITNKNLCYLEIAKKRGLKVISKIFMQDFFCMKLYANDKNGPCTRCLDKGYFEALKHKCIINNLVDYINACNRILIRKRLEKILPKINYVITSSDEQIGFYERFGIPKNKTIKTPLYFDVNRLNGLSSSMGNYYVGIAQNRIEKGFHFISEILAYCDDSIRIILAYNNKEQAIKAIKENNFQIYIDKGILDVQYDLKWETGLSQLVANARGVIIPSIWPTTTEFGLLEALGLGKPVFTFDVGIHSEIIENGVNGFKVPLGDCKTMAMQLNHFSNIQYAVVSAEAEILYNKLTDWRKWVSDLKQIGL